MYKWLNMLLCLACCIVAACLVASPLHAATSQPPKWPWHGINMDSTSSTPADIGILVSRLGINSVHLQIRPEKLGKMKRLSTDDAWAQAITWADAMLDACKRHHIVGIIEVSGVPLNKIQANTQTTPAFWTSSTKKQEYLQRLASLAKNLNGHGAEFAAYDIMSEPVLLIAGHAMRPPGWRKLQMKIVHTLRKYDPDRWILVKPGPFGSPRGYRDFVPLDAPRLIYSVHMYDPHKFTHQGIKHYPLGPAYPGKIGSTMWDAGALEKDLMPVINFQKKYNALIYVGEFGAVRWAPGAETYIKNLVDIFNAHEWGWAYFSYGGWNGWNPDYNDDYPASPKATKHDRVGTSSKRWATLRTILPASGKSN